MRIEIAIEPSPEDIDDLIYAGEESYVSSR